MRIAPAFAEAASRRQGMGNKEYRKSPWFQTGNLNAMQIEEKERCDTEIEK
jgi:hypothetical protein